MIIQVDSVFYKQIPVEEAQEELAMVRSEVESLDFETTKKQVMEFLEKEETRIKNLQVYYEQLRGFNFSVEGANPDIALG